MTTPYGQWPGLADGGKEAKLKSHFQWRSRKRLK